ncbi:hypothetical protein GCM10018790_30890 [Kitasatospora xanthocidica]|nr:hypothetical protein [Kitasatospora xanthocidica]GHF50910.1 hypothetical protein GCM10018790_30890 [Kitasatospora xanthocidica]
MTLLELPATSNTAVVTDLTGFTVTDPIAGPFDNRPTWDNWSNKTKGK